jgi:hypothetical protein
VTELAEPLDMSFPASPRILRVFERAELVARERDAQFRPGTLQSGCLARRTTGSAPIALSGRGSIASKIHLVEIQGELR